MSRARAEALVWAAELGIANLTASAKRHADSHRQGTVAHGKAEDEAAHRATEAVDLIRARYLGEAEAPPSTGGDRHLFITTDPKLG